MSAAANFLDLGGLQLSSCRVTIPLVGAWVADVSSPLDTALPAGPLTLTLGELELVGAVVREDTFGGDRTVRLVGGAGGWGKALPARGYRDAGGIPKATPLRDLALETGETIAPAELAAARDVLGVDYVREAAPAVRTLEQLVGGSWWVDGAGMTHIAPRATGAVITSDYLVDDYQGGPGRLVASTEALEDWTPGRVLDGPQLAAPVQLVDVSIVADDDGVLRVEALVVPAASPAPAGRLLASLRALIRQEVRALTFCGLWEYQVTSTAADGSTFDGLALAPGAPLPALRGVELRSGVPGTAARPAAGARALVGFANADPARPVCIALDGAAPDEVTLAAGATDAVSTGAEVGRVVRYGDLVQLPVAGALAAGALIQQAASTPNAISRVKA